MDIYRQAEKMNADYLDPSSGYIYKIQDYNKEKKLNPEAKIKVVSLDGKVIGYARKLEA